MSSITICIITHNNQHFIERCLISAKKIANEILVMDLESKDNTTSIIKKYGKLIKAKNTQDYAKLKNKLMKSAKSDWLLFLEPYEEINLENIQKISSLIKKYPEKKPYAFYFKIKNIQPEEYYPSIDYELKLIRNKQKTQFLGEIYPYIDPNKILLKKNSKIYIKNYSSFENPQKRYNQSAINIRFIIDNISKLDNSYHYYHLGNEYCKIYDFSSAVKAYDIALQKVNFKNKHLIAKIILKLSGTQLFCLNDTNNSLKNIDKLIKLTPDLPDSLFLLAFCKQKSESYKEALNIYETTLKLIKNSEGNLNKLYLPALEESLEPMIITNQAHCYISLNEIDYALNILLKIYPKYPKIKEIQILIVFCYLLKNNLKESLPYYLSNSDKKYSETELIELKEIAILDVKNNKYQNKLIEFLSGIEEINIWNNSERTLLENKLKELTV